MHHCTAPLTTCYTNVPYPPTDMCTCAHPPTHPPTHTHVQGGVTTDFVDINVHAINMGLMLLELVSNQIVLKPACVLFLMWVVMAYLATVLTLRDLNKLPNGNEWPYSFMVPTFCFISSIFLSFLRRTLARAYVYACTYACVRFCICVRRYLASPYYTQKHV